MWIWWGKAYRTFLLMKLVSDSQLIFTSLIGKRKYSTKARFHTWQQCHMQRWLVTPHVNLKRVMWPAIIWSLFRCSCSAVHRSQQTTTLQRVQHAPGLSQGVCLATFNIWITFKTLAKIKLLKIKIFFSLVSTQITLGMSGSRRSPSKHLQKYAQRTPVRFQLWKNNQISISQTVHTLQCAIACMKRKYAGRICGY
jgi:hypothetical protein